MAGVKGLSRGCWGLLLALLVAAAPAGAESYGEGVRLTEVTAIADILADPDAWSGRQVRVEGEVTDVCRKKGCWMSLTAADGRSAIRIKVDDGVIVFPLEATGRQAAAEGTVEILELDRASYEGWLAHLAEEQGETFDPSTVGEGPYRLVQIRGTGAVIAPAS